MYKKYIKRFLDLVLSLILFLLLSPFFVFILITLFFLNKGKPFFLQKRPGLKGHIFKVIKFKTMNDKRDSKGILLPDEFRLTKFGLYIRKLSLDELPQLLNVIIGDMSLIGPRPLLVKYIPLYDDFQKRRHDIRPGITGWAQVNGRNAISWEQKFEYDVWYVDHVSFKVDVKILLMTVSKVLKREGVSSDTCITMEEFLGNNR